MNIGYKYEYETARSIYYTVKNELKQEAAEVRENLIEELTSKLTDLYSKNYEKNDFKECREVLNSMSKILGLTGGNRVELDKGDERIIIDFN